MKNRIKKFLSLAVHLAIAGTCFSSDIIEVLPLTNKVIMLHFDDGSVIYPNTLTVDRLDIATASLAASYTITSNDVNYSGGVNPTNVGRKTKGTEFVKDVPWDVDTGSSNPTGKPWASEHFIYLVLEHALKADTLYTINTGSLAANGSNFSFVYSTKGLRSEAVHVNTLGYAANAPKYGYVYHWMGDLGGLNVSAYAGNTFSVYAEGTAPLFYRYLKL
ncbi:MAG: hypothetical protein HC896_16675 [Bacteroidales bacterium]|nr:hypothetical protein [Bacteroidales bacterium]